MIKFSCSFISMIAILAGASAAYAGEVSPVIQVRESVEVEMEQEITIGDIADFKGFNENEIGEIKSIRLSDAPEKDESRSFTNVSLSQIFRRHLPKLQSSHADKITLMIPTVVTVKRKAFRLEASAVEQELKTQWSAYCDKCEFRFNQISMPITSKDISVQSKWQIRTRPELPRGSFSVPLEVIGPEGRRSYWVSGQVAIYRQVPVAKRTLEIGEHFAANDFAFEKRETTYATDSIPSEAEVKDSVASRGIAADQVIGRSMLRREQALKMGEPVKVTVGSDAWQITVDGVAQQSGYIGDTVRVRVSRSQKLVSGTLREKGLVEVQ